MDVNKTVTNHIEIGKISNFTLLVSAPPQSLYSSVLTEIVLSSKFSLYGMRGKRMYASSSLSVCSRNQFLSWVTWNVVATGIVQISGQSWKQKKRGATYYNRHNSVRLRKGAQQRDFFFPQDEGRGWICSLCLAFQWSVLGKWDGQLNTASVALWHVEDTQHQDWLQNEEEKCIMHTHMVWVCVLTKSHVQF